MTVELKVPEVGESITEVQIGEWLFGEGDAVAKEETVVMIETDKVTVELIAPSSGTVGKILKRQGDAAAVGEVIGFLEDGPGRTAAASAASPAAAVPSSATAAAAAPAANVPPANAPVAASDAKVMPAAARVLAERGVSASDVQATGPGGRLLKEDVLRHPASVVPKVAPAPAAQARPTGEREEEVVPMTMLRRKVAERLVLAQQSMALLTTFNEIDMSEVMALRQSYKEPFAEKHQVKLGFMSFFVKAAVEALKAFPTVNAEIRGTDVVYHNFFDIGVAVGGGKGLVVPVLRHAEALSFAEIEHAIGDFGRRAQDGTLRLEELQGGTFTISNGGVYGSLMSTPIVNPPQSGILGLHAINERPVAIGGQVVVRPMMYVALTYDHRIIDGREAVGFLKRIKECIEKPTRILLEI